MVPAIDFIDSIALCSLYLLYSHSFDLRRHRRYFLIVIDEELKRRGLRTVEEDIRPLRPFLSPSANSPIVPTRI